MCIKGPHFASQNQFFTRLQTKNSFKIASLEERPYDIRSSWHRLNSNRYNKFQWRSQITWRNPMSYDIYECYNVGKFYSWSILNYPFTWELREKEVKIYQNLSKRLQSFENWTKTSQSALSLAVSGFFHTGW